MCQVWSDQRSGRNWTSYICLLLIQYVMCKVSFVGRGKMAKPDEGIPSCCQEHWGIHSGRPPLHSVKERSRHYIYDICGRFDHCTSCGKQCSIVNFLIFSSKTYSPSYFVFFERRKNTNIVSLHTLNAPDPSRLIYEYKLLSLSKGKEQCIGLSINQNF